MITPMMKYSLVLYHKDYQTFLEQLQELGLVDITITNWEPTNEERSMMANIESHRSAIEELRKLVQMKADAVKGGNVNSSAAAPTSQQLSDGDIDKEKLNAEKAFTAYKHATARIERLQNELIKVKKEIDELRPWGNFSVKEITKLRAAGVDIQFFTMYIKEFEAALESMNQQYTVTEISRDELSVYFVVCSFGDCPIEIEAQSVKAPTTDHSHNSNEKHKIEDALSAEREVINSCIPYISDFERHMRSLEDHLHLKKIALRGDREADGTLILLEAWATTASSATVDALLEQTGTFYIKERPTPEDETPVVLKNNKFARLSETIGSFYALPKYGTTDLTPFFGPFYMLFFGFCLGDGGYGLLYILGGLFMALRIKGMDTIGWLVVCCGAATTLFGILTGTFFGIELVKVEAFSQFKEYFLDANRLFTLAIAVGFVHLLFGMTVRIIATIKKFGIKYALSAIGWIVVIISSLAALLLPSAGVEAFNASSPVFMALVGIGIFLMLFFNSPGKNPLVNFGAGLWNTYNDVTGLLGDVLSYIRLFALCLSGSILALVFNDLAFGLSPDIPIIRELVIVILLVVGHGINIFMSSLSAFVHPMRLTFVEFYKNAGFEATTRAFNPLKKNA